MDTWSVRPPVPVMGLLNCTSAVFSEWKAAGERRSMPPVNAVVPCAKYIVQSDVAVERPLPEMWKCCAQVWLEGQSCAELASELPSSHTSPGNAVVPAQTRRPAMCVGPVQPAV